MEKTNNTTSRKKFFLSSLGVLASISAFNYFFGDRPDKKKKNTVKMLTQEGTLVEIDKALLDTPGQKITNDELKKWVSRKK